MGNKIHVAGDVCLDVLGIAMPSALSKDDRQDNWRETGETRTHYRLGGALLLTEIVAAAVQDCEVKGPRPCLPAELSDSKSKEQVLSPSEFLAKAERLTRKEIVHSLLLLDRFRAKPDSRNADTIRLRSTEGFSGPTVKDGDPSLKILPPESADEFPNIVVLDDTGNRFRRTPDQWPAAIANQKAANSTLVVHKLHRPLPFPQSRPNDSSSSQVQEGMVESPLWRTVTENHRERRIVIISIDDLREDDASVSRGLSWERTALELVWQLLNVEKFASLRDCPHLVVRLGLDGAMYWRHEKPKEDDTNEDYRAWIFYDPSGIEGHTETSCEGKMVAYGSAFTGGLVKHLLADSPNLRACTKDSDGNFQPPAAIIDGIRCGLLAAQRLLRIGFGENADEPNYPGTKLFLPAKDDETLFACQRVPIIPGAAVADRGYWRLIDAIFASKTDLLHRAVALKARNAKPNNPEDRLAADLLRQAPVAIFAKALRTYDRREIENYRALYSLMFDYVRQTSPLRPLSVSVFGPPGAGKSFGVKMVAKALQGSGTKAIESLTFNLSQYQKPDLLAAAFHLVRDIVLKGKIPLIFFDEFDTSLDGKRLGWLRYFLSPMQDAEFIDRGTPHPIGQSIFVFAGGTCNTYEEFASPFKHRNDDKDAARKFEEFKEAKGPDFLSRLRGTLDIPGLDLNPRFDSYGPTDAFPCEAAILLRRAGIFEFQLGDKASQMRDANKALHVGDPVIRGLLHLPKFEHGNRSFEALLDMSHLVGEKQFTPSLLPATGHTDLHAEATHLGQLLATEYPFSPADRTEIAKEIHEHYLEQRKAKNEYKADKPSHQEWSKLEARYVASNEFQADDIARKLRRVGLWFRKQPGMVRGKSRGISLSNEQIELLAREEHDRWVASQRSQGYIYGPGGKSAPYTHPCIMHWDDKAFPKVEKDKDLDSIRAIPRYLAAAQYEIVQV